MNRKVYMAVAAFAISILSCLGLLMWNKSIDKKKIEDTPPITRSLFDCTIGEDSIEKIRRVMTEKGLEIFDLDSASNELDKLENKPTRSKTGRTHVLYVQDARFAGVDAPFAGFIFFDSTLYKVFITLPKKSDAIELLSKYNSKYASYRQASNGSTILFSDTRTQIVVDTIGASITYMDIDMCKKEEEINKSEI
nr:MAG TPA: hypothetical protein [Caudoviricetes sp.]